ncbi:MAG TPA: hypothetical protein DCR95_00105 [Desulfobacter sp.]|uniref:hypothetical protein n=1 Tax=Desulfobacter sp. UBA2225 TaxID=1961413 RepID=UPI000E876D5A|nr:hypothetical protein [Desulfobacter sp. UBA2225]HAR32533.1 hypothetical protein [Desulfobacter sp.]
MFLHDATTHSEIIYYGIKPLNELLRMLEEELHPDLSDIDTRGTILWNEIRGKALAIEDAMERVHLKNRSRTTPQGE